MTAVTWPAYDSYNCDESLWLRNVPVDWSSMRLQHIATCNDNTLREFSYRDREIDYVDISSVDADSNTYTVQTMDFRNAPSRARRLAHHGDIVFSTVRPYLKAVATVANPNDKLVFSTGFAVIRPQPTVDPGFLGYVLRDHDFIAEVNMRSVGASYPAINATELLKLKVPFPPLSEQRVISAFLDEKCAKVDEAVRIKEEQIALLRQRRQILIQEAVTRGLDPDAPMKDSGIDWIGAIPAHWEVVPLKHLFRERNDRSTSGTEILLSLRMNEGLVPHDDVSDKPIGAEALKGYKQVSPGQVVMNRMRAAIGIFGIVRTGGIVSPDYATFDVADRANGNFFLQLFKTTAMGQQFRNASRGLGTGSSGFMRLYTDDFGAISVALPPYAEQREVVSHIQNLSEKIDAAVQLKTEQIAVLKEYKTTLINAAVTGKIKVA